MPSHLQELEKLVAQLRDPEHGCPWILVQTWQSLASLTIEESYELADSIERGDKSEILDELGDVLLHIILYAQLAKEGNYFDLESIAKSSLEKQLRRKPIFHKNAAKTAEDALKQWEENKLKEKTQRHFTEQSILDNIPRSLPSQQRALKIQQNVAKVGFQWREAEPIFAKLDEEVAEFIAETHKENNHQKMTEELGDILFTLFNIARHFNIDPELALLTTNNKFEHRFRKLEQHFKKQGKILQNASLEEMDAVWNQIKEKE